MMTIIGDLLVPPRAPVKLTQPLATAARLLGGARDYVTLVDSSGQPVGFLTRGDLDRVRTRHSSDWARTPCARAVKIPNHYLDPQASVEKAVEVFRNQGVKPLLIRVDTYPIGVLEPSSVFQWCAENQPETLEELAYLASAEERSHHPST